VKRGLYICMGEHITNVSMYLLFLKESIITNIRLDQIFLRAMAVLSFIVGDEHHDTRQHTTQHNTDKDVQTQDAHTTYLPKAVLRRVCNNNITVLKTPIIRGYTSILQIIDNNTDEILINDNEIDDLIMVLQEYKEQLRGYED